MFRSIYSIQNPFLGQLFIVNGADIYFRQEVVITLWCPMRFDYYPLDKQVLLPQECLRIFQCLKTELQVSHGKLPVQDI